MIDPAGNVGQLNRLHLLKRSGASGLWRFIRLGGGACLGSAPNRSNGNQQKQESFFIGSSVVPF